MAKRLVEFEIKPENYVGARLKKKLDEASPATIRRIEAEIKDLVVEQVLEKVGDTTSPVTGRSFKRLSSKYASVKSKTAAPIPNLELKGKLLDSVKVIKKDGELNLTVAAKEQGKADGHNKFNKARNKRIPARKFIPDEDKNEDFIPEIRNRIKDVIKKEVG